MKILLVDDSKSARYALRLELQRYGAEVATADSAEAAIELLKGDLPDAVFMDHTMLGLNGLEALDIIRADPRTARLPVIMCSSNEGEDFAAAARSRGANGILPKSAAAEILPTLLEQLRAAVPSAPPAPPEPSDENLTAVEPMVPGDLARLVEERVDALLDDHIEAHLSHLLEPLLRDLERGLAERLTAVAREHMESGQSNWHDTLEKRLAAERETAAATLNERLAAALESSLVPAVGTLLPQVLRKEIETERAQVLSLVDQYLREFTAREAAAANRLDARVGELDAIIATKAREIVRREVDEHTEEAVQRTRQTGEDLLRQLRSNQVMIYLSIMAAALAGILASAVVYYLLH
jgi:CheY-like chemotaxis protein